MIVLSNPDSGGVLGGLWGETNFAYLHVDLLFVPEALRGTGLGRQMLLQAEQEAIARGCRGAWLDTYSFQARGFYERLGYAVFGILNDYPPGQKRIFLHKVLVAWNDAQAGTTGQSSACFTAGGPARWPVSYFLTARHI